MSRPCAECGRDFEPTRESHIYCCSTCGNRAASRRQRRKVVEEKRFTGLCDYCHRPFVASRRTTRYCSYSCASTDKQKVRIPPQITLENGIVVPLTVDIAPDGTKLPRPALEVWP